MAETEALELRKIDLICDEAIKLISNKEMISKANDITQWLNVKHNLDITDRLVQQVLKSHLDLSYRRVNKNAYQSNSERNLVLR